MTFFPARMSATPVQLGTGATVLHLVPANRKDTITALVLKNATSTARTVQVWIAPAGAAETATMMIAEYTIPANSQQIVYPALGQVLNATDELTALSDAATAISAEGSVLASTA